MKANAIALKMYQRDGGGPRHQSSLSIRSLCANHGGLRAHREFAVSRENLVSR
ncbi:hypothetical protein CEXT_57311, partial [Caerostris extrusa]